MSDYTHLHLHTEYSLLDGANKVSELAELLQSRGTKACAITDHGNMFGAIDFYQTMKKHGIKPIIGIETFGLLKERAVPRIFYWKIIKSAI